MRTLEEKLIKLNKSYDKLQRIYGDTSLHSIYNGGCSNNPDLCFVFMNPTSKNISSQSSWNGPHYPWLGTKNIWNLFYKLNPFSLNINPYKTYNILRIHNLSTWDIISRFFEMSNFSIITRLSGILLALIFLFYLLNFR